MPTYTVEATYRVPVYRQRTYEAATPDEACRRAIEDDDWSNDKLDYEAAGETYVTGIWLGADAAYSGDTVPVLSHFDATIQRKAAHFEALFGLLKIVVADQVAQRRADAYWLARANAAVAKAEAILAGARESRRASRSAAALSRPRAAPGGPRPPPDRLDRRDRSRIRRSDCGRRAGR
jgi:hypothetical protein